MALPLTRIRGATGIRGAFLPLDKPIRNDTIRKNQTKRGAHDNHRIENSRRVDHRGDGVHWPVLRGGPTRSDRILRLLMEALRMMSTHGHTA
jgi:hypothetical protein